MQISAFGAKRGGGVVGSRSRGCVGSVGGGGGGGGGGDSATLQNLYTCDTLYIFHRYNLVRGNGGSLVCHGEDEYNSLIYFVQPPSTLKTTCIS